MKRRIAYLILAALAALSLSCKGSPTEPGSLVRLTITVSTPSSSDAIRRVSLLFDGWEIASAFAPDGSPYVLLKGKVPGVARGEHTIRVVIVDQASSPNSYMVGGAVTLPDRIMDLAPLQGLVATGEGLSIRINV